MLRGEIVLVDLEPTRGSEANKRRPAVLVSNDGANAVAQRLGRVRVAVEAVYHRHNVAAILRTLQL